MPNQTFFDLNEEKKNRIIQAAIHEFSLAPFEKVSIQAIIEAAQIPRGSFYQYFADKGDIYIYCMSIINQKAANYIYHDNLDVFWKRIHSFESQYNEFTLTPSGSHHFLEKILSPDEYRFMFRIDDLHSIPKNLLYAALCTDAANIHYPLFKRLLENDDSIQNPDQHDVLAFFLSMEAVLRTAYRSAADTTSEEAAAKINIALQALLHSFQSKKPETAHSKTDVSGFTPEGLCSAWNPLAFQSLHLISSSGTDLTLYFPEDSFWEICCPWGTDGGIVYISLAREEILGSMHLSLPAAAGELPAECPDTDFLAFTQRSSSTDSNDQECIISISHMTYRLPARELVGIAALKDGRRLCILEQGVFFS